MVRDRTFSPGFQVTRMTRGGAGGGAVGVNRGRGGQSGGSDGLNPNRQRGFNWQTRIVTPTLNDMRAKQGAVVSKFLTFMNRKNSIKIELYEKAFYNKKPGWDSMANFVHNDLCTDDVLRAGLEDVQYHPVKMIIFIKFKTEEVRDAVHAKLQAGVYWTEYGVTIMGHSLDANVRFIRILGVSPETTAEEIKNTFNEVGIGEVVDIKKGLLDSKRLPGVTNGTWLVRVKILDADKNIPPYIIRREEGELWSLNFEGRRFVCWKCGSPDHIGDKCRDQERTFEEVFGNDGEVAAGAEQSWAAVVRGDSVLDPAARAKRDEIAKQIKENNEIKDREKKELEEKKAAELAEKERERQENENARIRALEGSRLKGQRANSSVDELDDSFEDLIKTTDLTVRPGAGCDSQEVVRDEDQVPSFPPLARRSPNPRDPRIRAREQVDPGGGNRDSYQGIKRLVIEIDPALLRVGGGRSFQPDNTLDRIFGSGASRLAREFEGLSTFESIHNMSESSFEEDSRIIASTPKKRLRDSNGGLGNQSSISDGNNSGVDTEKGLEECESKKQKVEGLPGADDQLVIEHDNGEVESQQSGKDVQLAVSPVDPGTVHEPAPAEAQQDHDQSC